ncbi:MAG TPA: hypothetical protein VGO60_11195 [Iamia sp.]|jgi:hypothetical protein|nr:hypothetical protein [Iamia sp.]
MTDDAISLGALAARLDAVEAENRALRTELAAVRGERSETPGRAAAPGAAAPTTVGRRQALRTGLAAAGAAAVAAVVVDGAPAAATNGEAIAIGNATQTGTSPTRLQVTGGGKTYGFGVVDNTPDPGIGLFQPAIYGHAQAQSFFAGIQGVGEDAAVGVYGQSEGNAGVYGKSTSNTGLFAESVTGAGARIKSADGGALTLEGSTYHLALNGAGAAPTTDAVSHGLGEIVRDNAGHLWLCTGSGTPGTWRKLGGPGTAGQLHLLPAPIRVYDSRPGTTPAQTPKTPLPSGNVARTVDLKVNGSTVPAGATGALLTVLLVNAGVGAGNVTVWANDKPKPQANTLVWGGDAGRFTTLAVSSVDAQARVKVDASLQTNLVLDVVGYYR